MWRQLFPSAIVHYVRAWIIALAIAGYILFQNGFDVWMAYVNALTSAGILLILIGLLMLTVQCGVFDSLGFTSRKVKENHRRDGMVKELARQSYWDYLQTKRNQRKVKEWTFMAYIWVGLVLTAIGFVVECWIV